MGTGKQHGIEGWLVPSVTANTWHRTPKGTNSHERKNGPGEPGQGAKDPSGSVRSGKGSWPVSPAPSDKETGSR